MNSIAHIFSCHAFSGRRQYCVSISAIWRRWLGRSAVSVRQSHLKVQQHNAVLTLPLESVCYLRTNLYSCDNMRSYDRTVASYMRSYDRQEVLHPYTWSPVERQAQDDDVKVCSRTTHQNMFYAVRA